MVADVTDADIVVTVMNRIEDQEDDEDPREIPTVAETKRLLHLLQKKIECSGGAERLMRGMKALENAFLVPNATATQAQITSYFSVMWLSNNEWFV